jgi:hypothetical protein
MKQFSAWEDFKFSVFGLLLLLAPLLLLALWGFLLFG